MSWSQATLCNGICAVSYLSKIEQGKAEASPEVLELLFRRLGIRWREAPDFCQETSAWLEDWYEYLFSGEETDGLEPDLDAHREDCLWSPYATDWLLLHWLASEQKPEGIEEYLPAMDGRQRNLYLCLNEQYDELLWTADQSYYLLKIGASYCVNGRYTDAVSCLQRCMEQACREGRLPLLMLSQMWLGSCSNCLNQLEQACKYYAAARRMAKRLNRQAHLLTISYNLACTEFQMGMTDAALRHLLEYPWNEAVYYHKLAICYEKLGKREAARAALGRALTAPQTALGDSPEVQKTFWQMCQLIRIRLDDPNYLKNQEYGSILISCTDSMRELFPISFIRSQSFWLEEWYTANRQYQKAYETIRRIFLENNV